MSAGFLPLRILSTIAAYLPIDVCTIWTVGHETTRLNINLVVEHCRQFFFCRKIDDSLLIGGQKAA